jgi:AAA domain
MKNPSNPSYVLPDDEFREQPAVDHQTIPFDGQEPVTLKGASLLAYSKREINHELTLLGNRWLCAGGGAMIVGPSGIGKSTLSIQAAALWACGESAFGIKPARALRVLIIQAEDDEGDSIEMARVVTHLKLDQTSLDLIDQNTHLEFLNNKTGFEFAKYLSAVLELRKSDLIIINPFSSYAGGDLKDPKITVQFLRTWLNPILTAHQVGVIFIHHTPKTNFRDTAEWRAGDWMYAGAGNADITNWARAYLVVEPTEIRGVYKFIAAKRGQRIGWGEELPVFETYWAHSNEEKIVWVPADSDQITAAQKSSAREPDDLLKLIPILDPISQATLQKTASEKGFGEKKTRQFLEILEEKGKIHRHTIPRPGRKSAIGYSQNRPSE